MSSKIDMTPILAFEFLKSWSEDPDYAYDSLRLQGITDTDKFFADVLGDANRNTAARQHFPQIFTFAESEMEEIQERRDMDAKFTP